MAKKTSKFDSRFPRAATLLRLHKIFELNFLQMPENIQSPFYKSVFMECVIELRYLLEAPDFETIIPLINFKDEIPDYPPTRK